MEYSSGKQLIHPILNNYREDTLSLKINRNTNLHKDLNIPTIRKEIKSYSTNYMKRLAEDPYPLTRGVLTFESHRRLRRLEILDLRR